MSKKQPNWRKITQSGQPAAVTFSYFCWGITTDVQSIYIYISVVLSNEKISNYFRIRAYLHNQKLILLSICNIGNITFHLMMAKYLLMLPRGKTVRQQTEKFCSSRYEIMKCQQYIAIERNRMKVSDLTEKISWNIVALINFHQLL